MRGRKRWSRKRDAKEGREGKIGIRSHTAREQRVCNRQTGAARRRHAPWQRDGGWGAEKRGVASAPRTCGPGARRKGGRDRDGGGDATGVAHRSVQHTRRLGPSVNATVGPGPGRSARRVAGWPRKRPSSAPGSRQRVGPQPRPAVRHRRTSRPSVTRRAIPLANGAVTNHEGRGSNARAASCPLVPVRKKRWHQGPRVHKKGHRW